MNEATTTLTRADAPEGVRIPDLALDMRFVNREQDQSFVHHRN